MSRARRFGPGFLVAAAFIGPGTVTTASLAGAGFGYQLAWAIVFSVIATVVLQEMSARVGLVTRHGLGEAIRASMSRPWARTLAVALVITAIGFGNTAYQAGNIIGAGLGLEGLTGFGSRWWILLAAISAGGLLASGAYKAIERVLVGLVALMAVLFVGTAILVHPDLAALGRAIFVPHLPGDATLTALALVGTTVVPYNLFLHAGAVTERWPAGMDSDVAIAEMRVDTALSVSMGGLVTLAIMLTAVPFFVAGLRIEGVGHMANQLEPLLGAGARYLFALGLFAAGLTSAITAPLAAGFAVCGAMGWERTLSGRAFRITWIIVLGAGTVFALIGYRPLQAILVAQAANAVLLPLVAGFLLFVCNRESLMGARRNGALGNALGLATLLLTLGLSALQLYRSFR